MGTGLTIDDTVLKVYTLDEVVHLYKLNFNVLVADCEGCFETFIDENKEFFKNLRLVIFEADRSDICNYNKIRQFLTETGFVEIETRPHGSDPNFQNVWEKVKPYIGIL